jgi:branched-chain amino acid transport system ATP-binding protein
MLEVNDIVVHYGKIAALRGVSLHVEKGEIVTLIGANGAGKTTTIMTISGVRRATSGTITFDGDDITALEPDEIVRRGIVQVPEGRRIFHRLTVAENLRMGAYTSDDPAVVRRGIERAYEVFPVLAERRDQRGGTLSGGEQQMLAIARGMMTEPRLLMLDEPSLGLAPRLVSQMFRTIRQINVEGVSVLLVEQNAQKALATAGRGYVLETGMVSLQDEASALLENEDVRKAYLGA